MDKPVVSIIIPFKELNKQVHENIQACLLSSYHKFEILLVPDRQINLNKIKNCRVLTSGNVGPAVKRDIAAKEAKGEILAFIDDDVLPTNYWLAAIVSGFKNREIAAVGGPGITPLNVGWRETGSGWFSASPIGSGGFSYRFLPRASRYVDDYPSMNLAVRKADFQQVGGFDSAYWPGEDTKLCMDIVHKLGKKILYEPTAVVYHHRRSLWGDHLRQHGNFGIHRGFFARVLPKTSLRGVYFLPSGLVLGLCGFIVGWGFWETMRFQSIYYFWLMVSLGCFLVSYLVSVVVNAIWVQINSGSWKMAMISVPVTVVTHLWYGIRFLQGFIFTRKLNQ